ncbi:zinc-dependent metalloprotease [Flavobacterium sp.]|uniref:zinc-dependent metalloprotease n=1 Tax=Flavobacterium sp. TaxID=239 RepID=UPI002FDAF901
MKKLLLFLAIVLSFGQMLAQAGTSWRKISLQDVSKYTRVRENITAEDEQYFSLDLNSFKQTLVNAKDKFSNQPGVLVEIPNMNGEIETFEVWENSNFDAELQAKYPSIRAYAGKGVTDAKATINFSLSPQGIQTMIFRADSGMEFIEAYDKGANAYVVFNSNNRNKGKLPFKCSTIDRTIISDLGNQLNLTNKSNNKKYSTLKLAISCTAEYSNYFGATSVAGESLVIAAFNATMTRVNGVYERDVAAHLNIIASTTSVIYYNAATDPYDDADIGTGNSATNNYISTWNAQLMNALHNTLTDTPFDIGHLFGQSGGGGNAGCIGCICSNDMSVDTDGSPTNYKGSGFTSPYDGIPQGDNYDIDYVAHEMGHQLGATHSFTHSYEGTTSQVEPGSGSTIMGYAGVTSLYDVQAHSDALFAYKNIAQIQSILNSKPCPVKVTMTDAVPVVSAGADYIIPRGTPFLLTGTATDADGDAMTYVWEENDLGTSATAGNSSKVSATKAVGPNFRTFSVVSTPKRYLPQMSKILLAQLTTASNWESVYNATTANRDFNFTFTARDNHAGGGQTQTDAMKVTVDVTKGPFAVTSQATTGITYAGSTTQTVTWNVLSTDALAGGATVDILLSTNANLGNLATFDTVLATGVTNNGSATVVIPNLAATSANCRFMVRANGNIFFAVNSKNFTITQNLATEDFGLQHFVLYPNPNKGSFNIQFDSAISNEIKVNVYDMRGRKIFDNTYSNEPSFNQNIQLNNVETGIYLVTVIDGNRKVVKRITIE